MSESSVIEPHHLSSEHGIGADCTLLDVIDRVLDQGIVIRGELWLTVADIELLFIGADLVIASPDKMRRTRSGPVGERATPKPGDILR